MKWFYRMRLGRLNSQLVFVLILAFAAWAAVFTRVWQDFSAEKLGVFAICVGGGAAMACMNRFSYSNAVDGKHSFRMKIYLDAAGMTCRDREFPVWSCRWTEIRRFERRTNTHRCRSVYVYLSGDEEKPFHFEYSRSAKKALFAVCPRADRLPVFTTLRVKEYLLSPKDIGDTM